MRASFAIPGVFPPVPLNGDVLVDVDYDGVDQSAATGEQSAFNLTITNQDDGTTEFFPSVSLNFNKTSYVLAVVNDPDTGSQIANITLATPWGATPTTTPPTTPTEPTTSTTTSTAA